MRWTTLAGGIAALAIAAFLIFVPNWSHPPIYAVEVAPPPASQILFRVGQMPEPVPQTPPAPLPKAETGGARATQTYKNVQVLTDLSAAEFMRLQQAMTQWVAPKSGCGFCHEGEDYASDAKPQKQAARLMLRMTRHINADWGRHVKTAGVTCFTCHRGQAVPAETWFPTAALPTRPMIAKQENWQEAADNVRKFFPDNGYDLYLLEDTPISVQSTTALPGHTVASQIVAKRVYEMMMTISDGMGVNCGYCHNSRAFESWEQSTPHRWEGHDGLGLTRDLNRHFLLQLRDILPLTRSLVDRTSLPVLPARQDGVQNGNGLVLCATCHEAQPKPMGGADVLSAYPELGSHNAAMESPP